MISAIGSKPRSVNGGINIWSPATILAEISSLVTEVIWENFPVVERKRVNTGRCCNIHSASRNSLNMDHSSKLVPFRVVKVCASSKHRVITGLERILPSFFFLDLLGVGDGGALHIESINATKVASAS